jgi:hypothetical protein
MSCASIKKSVGVHATGVGLNKMGRRLIDKEIWKCMQIEATLQRNLGRVSSFRASHRVKLHSCTQHNLLQIDAEAWGCKHSMTAAS